MKNRTETARQLLRNATAEFLAREAGPQSLITVTRADIADNFGEATIYLSVLPEEKEQAALDFVNRSVVELKAFLKSRTKLPRTPHIEFAIDRGEKNRQRLDQLG